MPLSELITSLGILKDFDVACSEKKKKKKKKIFINKYKKKKIFIKKVKKTMPKFLVGQFLV